MRRVLQGGLTLIAGLALFAPGIAIDSQNIAEVEKRIGQVQIRPPSLSSETPFNEGWENFGRSALIAKQGWTRTYQRSVADCRSLTGEIKCRIGPRTLVSIQDFLDSPDEISCTIWLPEGAARVQVPPVPGKKRNYEVRTSNAVLSARGTQWLSQYCVGASQPDPFDPSFNLGAGAGETRMAVREGVVNVGWSVESGYQVDIPAGHTARIDGQGIHLAPGTPLPPPPPGKAAHIFDDGTGMEFVDDNHVRINDGKSPDVDLSDQGLQDNLASFNAASAPLVQDSGAHPIERGTFTEAGGPRENGSFQNNGSVPLGLPQAQPPSVTCPPPGGGNCAPPCMP